MRYALAALGLALSSAAGAAPTVTGEAQLEWKVQSRDKIIVDETIWRCSGNICRGELVDHAPTKLRSCMKLARYAERVTAFRTPAGGLSEEDLVRCNGGR